MRYSILALVLLCFRASCLAAGDPVVGPARNGSYVVPTQQLIRPAGQTLEFGGRPVDLVLSPDKKTLYVKTNSELLVVDAGAWNIRQHLGGQSGSYHGMAITRDGSRLYVTTSANTVAEALVAADGTVSLGRKIEIPGPEGKGKATPCGIALSPGERLAYVCLSRNNSLGVIDLKSGKLTKQIPVGVAPYDVILSPDGLTAWVSNWGGRRAKDGEKTENSAGTPTLVDERSIANSGTLSLVDLKEGRELAQIATDLHPCDLQLDPARNTLYVANANSDTVSVIDTRTHRVIRSINTKPDESLPFGSAPNALLLGSDGKTLYVADGGNNAVAVIDYKVRGFIPAGWYPGALATDGRFLYIANVKGVGSRNEEAKKDKQGWTSHMMLGSVQKVEIPGADTLRTYTRQVKEDAQVPQALRAFEKAQSDVKPVPVPERVGEPSVFEHVIYIIKENKTYDQVFGDMPKGNSDPALCTFGREISPNHHALAEQFVLLDNFYCNGVLSADGHQWATQGYVTDYLEKGFGGFPRSYPYNGDDPMAYSSAGFIWDNVLLHGLSFRNYGEMSTDCSPKGSYKEVYADYVAKAGKFSCKGSFDIETLRRYSCQEYPGWTLRVPEQVRADIFLREFAEFEKKGDLPNFITIMLPNDHTAGLNPGSLPPRGYMADNDLALGRIVEAVSKSSFWPKTCIFVIEDDPQSGYDHVDGHRSLCLVASPYTKRGALVSEFYNQTSVLRTMELILGIPPMTQMDAMAPVMRECFTGKPDLSPYTALPSNVALDEVNPEKEALSGKALFWTKKSMALNFDAPDVADEDTLNRIVWHSVKGFDTPYPAAFAGPHGKGLKALNLALADVKDEDD